jgi:hypothetical protein
MAKDNMTIRFTPDGFSFTECPGTTSILLDEAPFHEVAPGPDFQLRLQDEVLNALPESETLLDLTIQIVSTRVILLPPGITDADLAAEMYQTTLSESAEEEEILLQPLTLPTGQEVMLCFGIERSLYNFLQRNYGELTFEHHLATLLIEGARMANGNCLVVRCDEQFLEIALFRKKVLSLVNVYQTTQAENRSFYVMNTWVQEGLDQLQDYLLVLSRGNEGLQVRASLHRYIKHVYS